MKKNETFKGLSIEHFWKMFIEQVYESMLYAQALSNGDPKQRQRILSVMADMLYVIMESIPIFKYKNIYDLYFNITVFCILDYIEKYQKEDINVDDVFECVKKNWIKNEKLVHKMMA